MSEHGGSGAKYVHEGCRCDECRAANTRRVKRRTAERKVELAENPDLPVEHGSASTYMNWGCRCVPCTAANTEYCAPYVRAYYDRKRARRAG